MKRKPLILSIALLFVVGAALWGVNYRLDHPPLTKADKEFRALVKGADKVELTRLISLTSGSQQGNPTRTLNPAQTRELIEQLRFVTTITTPSRLGNSTLKGAVLWDLKVWRADQRPVYFMLAQTPQQSVLQSSNLGGILVTYRLNPRFNKRLNRVLDAYLPQRIRP